MIARTKMNASVTNYYGEVAGPSHRPAEKQKGHNHRARKSVLQSTERRLRAPVQSSFVSVTILTILILCGSLYARSDAEQNVVRSNDFRHLSFGVTSLTPKVSQRLPHDRTMAAAAVTVPSNKHPYWGAIVTTYHPQEYRGRHKHSYAVAWNFPTERAALDAAIAKCTKTIGIPCWPRRRVFNSRVPGDVFTFSTSAPTSPEAGWNDAYYAVGRIVARCALIYYDGHGRRYSALFAKTEQEAQRLFQELDESYRVGFQQYYRAFTVAETVCNNK